MGNQGNRATGEAISRQYLGRYVTPRLADTPPLYCGYLGSRTELEIRLWKHVESRLSEEEEQSLLSHADACVYCQSRIRDIAKAMCESVHPPDLILRLEKVTARVMGDAGEFLADLLVAVENTGKWLYGSLGAGLVLKPVPTTRGLAGGSKRCVPSAAASQEQPVRSLTSSFKASTTVEGVTVSCEISRSASGLVFSIDTSGRPDDSEEPGLTVTCSADSVPVTASRSSLRGSEFVVPQDCGKVEFTICKRDSEIGHMVVEME
jgi:hypothetical protein